MKWGEDDLTAKRAEREADRQAAEYDQAMRELETAAMRLAAARAAREPWTRALAMKEATDALATARYILGGRS
jgi:hypothetical protein